MWLCSRICARQPTTRKLKLPKTLPLPWTRARRRIAAVYDKKLAGTPGLALPFVGPGREHVYHLYVVRHQRRNELKKFLAEAGIETVINYPVALPFLPAYARLGAKPEDFPNAYRNQSMVLSLPMFPEMTPDQQNYVVEMIKRFCSNG